MYCINFKFIGELLNKARATAGETYLFKKGYSRSKSSSSTNSDEKSSEPSEKRKKIMAAERLREIESLKEVIKSTEDQIDIKRQRVQRAKNVNDFALCDSLSTTITALLVEKAEHERQLAALNKKEAKSKRYLLKKSTKTPSRSRKIEKSKNLNVLDMFSRTKTPQKSDSQVISLEEEQSVLERSESASSADTLILEKSDVVSKQSTDSQVILVEEEQSVLERSESASSADTLILEKTDVVSTQSTGSHAILVEG